MNMHAYFISWYFEAYTGAKGYDNQIVRTSQAIGYQGQLDELSEGIRARKQYMSCKIINVQPLGLVPATDEEKNAIDSPPNL